MCLYDFSVDRGWTEGAGALGVILPGLTESKPVCCMVGLKSLFATLQVLMAVVMQNLVNGVCAAVDRSPKLVGCGRHDILSAAKSLSSSLGDPAAARSWSQLEAPFQVSSMSVHP